MLRKMVPARGHHKSEASGLSSNTVYEGDNRKVFGSRAGGWIDQGVKRLECTGFEEKGELTQPELLIVSLDNTENVILV